MKDECFINTFENASRDFYGLSIEFMKKVPFLSPYFFENGLSSPILFPSRMDNPGPYLVLELVPRWIHVLDRCLLYSGIN